MFSPSLNNQSLGMSRRDGVESRGADLSHNLLEWSPPTSKPAASGFFAVRDKLKAGSLTRRVLFTGSFWMADEPVAAWRPVLERDYFDVPFNPVSNLAQKATKAGFEVRPSGAQLRKGELIGEGACAYGQLSLVPLDQADSELRALQKLAGLELRVEVVRFSKPADDACGVSTGRVLAVSENYAAQDLGSNNVLIHENSKLSRTLQAGENVTLAYESGTASVYDGLMHDVNVIADWMPREQQVYMRMVMLDAMSMIKSPASEDVRFIDALRYALESTANFFGLEHTRLRRADIKLVVDDKAAVLRADSPEPNARPRAARPS